MLRRMPVSTKCFEMGYGASEGKLNIPTKRYSIWVLLQSMSVFYEFRPLTRRRRHAVSLGSRKDGEAYELIITTYSGLYRYNMLDIVCE